MKTPGPFGRWAAFRRLLKGLNPIPHHWSPEAMRNRQRHAAREAFLATQPADRRVLTAPYYGDTH